MTTLAVVTNTPQEKKRGGINNAPNVPEQLTLREYGRDMAARHSTGESRLQRALRGLRLGHGALRVPHARFA